MNNADKDMVSAAQYRQILILQDKAALIRAVVENEILKNQKAYEIYDYNNRHRIMKNDIVLSLANHAEYQTITRNIIQLESEYENMDGE